MDLGRCMGCMKPSQGRFCPHCGHDAEKKNAPHQLQPGTELQGQYILGKVLGQGGFGITYLGWDKLLERTVAIKEFYPSTVVNRDITAGTSVRVNTQGMEDRFSYSRERFLREARALAAVTDIPETVDIHGSFSENNTAYIVMEYVRGRELSQYVAMRGGRLSFDETMRILEPVARALERVHQKGLVHRDISPDNIMLHPMGAKLLDFGAVRAVENPDVEKDLENSTEAVVKQGFAPLEQYRSRGGIGPWSDVYAFCGTVYYCLTGRVPPDALARSLGEEEPDWTRIPDLSEQRRRVLEKGMAIFARDRYASAGQLLEALLKEQAPPVPEIPEKENKAPQKKKKKAWIPAALILLALSGAAALLAPKLLAAPEETLREPETTAGTQLLATAQTLPIETEPQTEPSTQPQTEAETEPPAQTEPEETFPDTPWSANVLMEDPLSRLDVPRANIRYITFLDNPVNAPFDALDVSRDADRSVLAWRKDNRLYIAAAGGINARYACEGLFEGCTGLEQVTFGGAFHAEQATSMSRMFYLCSGLKQVDTENLDVSHIRNMSYMFCANPVNEPVYENRSVLERLNVSSWDMSRVEDASYMFYCCDSLKTLDVASWNLSSAKKLRGMFAYCRVMTTLDVSDWDLSSAEDLGGMFMTCSTLPQLDVSRWNVSRAAALDGMFKDCVLIRYLPVRDWDVSSAQNMASMFENCNSLQVLEVTDWNVGSVTDMSRMFFNCYGLSRMDISGWDLENVVNYAEFMSEGVKLGGIPWQDYFVKTATD